MHDAFWGLTRDEVTVWALSTPVQFYSAARFYRDAYYSMRSGVLGMAVLGTRAAYLYSVAAVL
jgi:cation transport ATPase